MSEIARSHARELARASLAKGDATGWFEALYAGASGDAGKIPWADLKPNPNLLAWLDAYPMRWQRALAIGCGLGDDAEELARRGCQVTAFDVSSAAVNWCRNRFPESSVDYQVADLTDPPQRFTGMFDLVLESYTLQVLPPQVRPMAIRRCAEFVAPGGRLLIICRGRDPGDPDGKMPWPLLREELNTITQDGRLREVCFEDYFDDEEPPARRFRVEYRSI